MSDPWDDDYDPFAPPAPTILRKPDVEVGTSAWESTWSRYAEHALKDRDAASIDRAAREVAGRWVPPTVRLDFRAMCAAVKAGWRLEVRLHTTYDVDGAKATERHEFRLSKPDAAPPALEHSDRGRSTSPPSRPREAPDSEATEADPVDNVPSEIGPNRAMVAEVTYTEWELEGPDPDDPGSVASRCFAAPGDEAMGRKLLAALEQGPQSTYSVKGIPPEKMWNAKAWVLQQGIALESRMIRERTAQQIAAGPNGCTSSPQWRLAGRDVAEQESLF